MIFIFFSYPGKPINHFQKQGKNKNINQEKFKKTKQNKTKQKQNKIAEIIKKRGFWQASVLRVL